MGIIRILPPEVVNRIAAGEVIERPGSVLKELIENSIDAGATLVRVELEAGGTSLVRVRDNGSGMERDDLPLAFASHATSKLPDSLLESNLLGISSLGFRGEALASIASVAMVSVLSRRPGADHAWRYRPGEGEPEPAAGEQGTTIEVRNLFYSVPARRKFLRAPATEFSHCLQQLTRLAMAFPGIGFELEHGGRDVVNLRPVDGLRERLHQILGDEAEGRLLEVGGRSASPVLAGRPEITGFVGNPRLHRKDAREQHFFVNGRWVRDRSLSHALRSAYEGFQIPGHQPVAYLFVDILPQELDVNVHPTKTEVRFRDSASVYRLVHGAVRAALECNVSGRSGVAEDSVGAGAQVAAGHPAAAGTASPLELAVKDFLARPEAGRVHMVPGSSRAPLGAPRALWPDLPPPAAQGEAETAPERGALVSEEGRAPPGPAALQVLRSYIVLEGPDGIVIVDQHALHEKILFEEIHERLAAGRLESQRLLIPEIVDVAPELMPFVDGAAALLAPLGFEIAPFGMSSVAVHGFPALFDRETGPTDLPGIIRGVLEDVRDDPEARGLSPPDRSDERAPAPPMEAPPAFRKALRSLAATVACKRAVKAGTALSLPEIRALLERGSLADDPRNCPHGRPTAAFLSRRDIERQFDRK